MVSSSYMTGKPEAVFKGIGQIRRAHVVALASMTSPEYSSLTAPVDRRRVHGDIFANRERWDGLGEGKTALVTGANAGLGFFTTLALAASGAKVILACRNESRANRAMEEIQTRVPQALLEFSHFDSSSMDSASSLAAKVAGQRLDIVIANAGLIRSPAQRVAGALGYEQTMTTNFFGHARLVGELAASFRTHPARFIGLGSMATHLVKTNPANLRLTHDYHPYRAYAQSKAALQSLSLALDHRLRQLAAPSRSIAVHPGYSISGLSIPVAGINKPSYLKRVRDQLQSGFAQGKHEGSVSIVEAALAPEITTWPRGAYLGPKYVTKGLSVQARPAKITREKKTMDAVWEMFIQANHGLDPYKL